MVISHGIPMFRCLRCGQYYCAGKWGLCSSCEEIVEKQLKESIKWMKELNNKGQPVFDDME